MKTRLTLAALALVGLSFGANAATFEAKQPYQIHLVDGKETASSITKNIHSVELSEGQHQLAISYTKDYSNRSDLRVLNGDPVIITLDVAADDNLILDYRAPVNYQLAKQFLREQASELSVIDKNTGQKVTVDMQTIPTPAGLNIAKGIQASLVEKDMAFNGRTDAAVAAATAKFGDAAVDADSLDMLKYWWNSADKDTQRAFQIWLIQQ